MFRAVYPPPAPRMLHLHMKITKQQRKYFSYSQLDAGVYSHFPLARSPLITSKTTNRADRAGRLGFFLFFLVCFFFDRCIIKCVRHLCWISRG